MKLNKKLVAPALGLACCMAIGVGTTYALFTSQDNVNIAVTAGKVAVKASVGGLELYSPKAISTEAGNAITDSTNIASEGTFGNGGTAVVENGTLKLSKLTPGDKVAAKLTVKNESNVAAKYRVKIAAGDEASTALLSGMKVGFDYDLDGTVNDLKSIKSVTTAWATLPTEDTEYAVSFELPTTAGDVYQGLSASLTFSVEAVQANAAVTGGLVIERIVAEAKKVANEPTATSGVYNVPAAEMVADSGSTAEMGAVSFTAAEGWTTSDSTDSTVIFSAVTNDAATASASATFEVAEDSNITGSLDLSMVVDGEAVIEFDVPVTIETNIGIGLDANKVKVVYRGVDLKDDANAVTTYAYDPSTGVLSITTDHFSEYYIVANKIVAPESPKIVDPEPAECVKRIVTSQTELATAVSGAQTGDVISITAAGTYTVPNISKNIVIVGAAQTGDVVFNCEGSGSIAKIPNGASFKNVVMNFGTANYHGFQHAGKILMHGCTLNGLLFSYGDMIFQKCTFNAPGPDYAMWDYGQNLVYNACTFNGAGKFVNVYNEGNGDWDLGVYDCRFISTKANKSALNIKAACLATNLDWDVTIAGCTYEGPAPAVETSDTLYRKSSIWQVDDMNQGKATAEQHVSVNCDGRQVFGQAKTAE